MTNEQMEAHMELHNTIEELRSQVVHLRAQVEQLTADAAEWRRAYNTLERSEFQLREELSEAYSQINILRAQVLALIMTLRKIESKSTDAYTLQLAARALNAIQEQEQEAQP